jgi:hypothetical protein
MKIIIVIVYQLNVVLPKVTNSKELMVWWSEASRINIKGIGTSAKFWGLAVSWFL